jgi:Uma2 family endonuclease
MTTLIPQPAQKQASSATPKRVGSRVVALKTSDARIRKGKVELVPKPPKYDGLRMDKADFLAWERDSDGWKYEWNNGRIENNEVNMTQRERGIVENIMFTFEQTAYRKRRDAILPETDCEFTELGVMRRPDLAYFTKEQVEASKRGENPIPLFVIELVSKHDKNLKRYEKINEYFRAGVQCVWYIYPEQYLVEVYSSPTEVRIIKDEIPCSAAPALPDFFLTPNQLFA